MNSGQFPESIIIADPQKVDLEPDPIPAEWILSGAPKGSSKIIARNQDSLLTVVVWECTAGTFNWNYAKDEILFVVSGEANLVNEKGHTRRFGPGDVVFFPAGTACTWVVHDRIRKVAVLKESVWRPLGLGIGIWRRIRRAIWWRLQSKRGRASF